MEGGDNFNQQWRNNSISLAGTNKNKSVAEQPQQQPTPQQEKYLPISQVNRLMRRALPPYTKISDDAKEAVQLLMSEYISFISSEANDRCRRHLRNTITTEDMLESMKQYTFDHHVRLLTGYQNGHLHLDTTNMPTVGHMTPGHQQAHVTAAQASVQVQVPMPMPPMANVPVYPQLGVGCLTLEAINNFSRGNPGTSKSTRIFEVSSSSSSFNPNDMDALMDIDLGDIDALMDFDPFNPL